MAPKPVTEDCGAGDLVVLWNVRRAPSVSVGASSAWVVCCWVPRRKADDTTLSALASDITIVV